MTEKLTPDDFRVCNRFAVQMNQFHDMFRGSWDMLYTAAANRKRPAGISARQFISAGLQFCSHLEMHHSIEEQYVFPKLAQRMPAFQRELQLLTQHKQIHAGLDKLQDYLQDCKSGDNDLHLQELKGIMDSFKDILWQHLDDEVEQLGAESMRKYYSVEELRNMELV